MAKIGKVDYWECVGCGKLSEQPFPGRIIEVKLTHFGRVAKMECETCQKMVMENAGWLQL